jgi:hypothetical protein
VARARWAVVAIAFLVVAVSIGTTALAYQSCNGVGGNTGACLTYKVSPPGSFLPNPLIPTTTSCPTNFRGMNVTYMNDSIYLCATVGEDTYVGCSSLTTPGCLNVSTTSCSEGVHSLDPVVEVGGYSIFGCVVTQTLFERPPVNVFLGVCSGLDPTVQVGNGEVQFCFTP